MKPSPEEIEAVRAHVAQSLPPKDDWFGFPGWRDQIEAALIDAVFSAQARYGTETTGVRAVVARWEASQPGRSLDSLDALLGVTAREFRVILANDQRVPGTAKDRMLKADAVREVAKALTAIGVRGSKDFLKRVEDDETQLKAAFTSPPGVGPVTFSYCCMLLGHADIKADTMIRRFVADAVKRPEVPTGFARDALRTLADQLETDPIALDHAIWRWQRGS